MLALVNQILIPAVAAILLVHSTVLLFLAARGKLLRHYVLYGIVTMLAIGLVVYLGLLSQAVITPITLPAP